jgi:hypothetical protein
VRCRPRTIILTADQHHLIWFGLTGGYSDEPTRNILVANENDCSLFEQMVRMGLMKFVCEVMGLRRYDVTEAGAAAVGLSLP